MSRRPRDYAELVWRGLVWLPLTLWGVWARLVNRLPESWFSPPPAPVEMPVLEKPTDDEIAGFKQSIERRKVFHEETSKTIRRILYTLIATCLFCVVTLSGTSDVHLLAPDSKVELPILNYPMSFTGFLVVGPVVLIGLTAYLHIFIGQHRIATVPIEDRFAMLANFEGGASRLVAILLLYWMVPLTLSEFAWKAKPRAEGFELYMVACVVAAGLGYLQFRRCPQEYRTRGLALLLCAVVLYFFYTTERIRNRHLSLFDTDLSELDLRGANLESVFLREANLKGTNLSLAKLQGADLVYAQLQGAHLRGAQLQGADLTGADLQEAVLLGAQLQGADLARAQLQGAVLILAELQKADLRDAQLQGADLIGADLQEADLRDADLQEADLRGAQLQGADLARAQLQGADLTGADLQEAALVTAQLQGANLARADLQGADLRGAQLQGAALSGAQLQGADLRGAQLQGADLARAQLQGATFSFVSQGPTVRSINILNLVDLRLSIASSGAFYFEDQPPNIHPSLLVHFTAVSDECTWIIGMHYGECAGRTDALGFR